MTQIPIFMTLTFWWERQEISKINKVSKRNRHLNGHMCLRKKSRTQEECEFLLPGRPGQASLRWYHCA